MDDKMREVRLMVRARTKEEPRCPGKEVRAVGVGGYEERYDDWSSVDVTAAYSISTLSFVVQLLGACRPQVTIATAIIFCHRFFLRQSHTRNDRRSIATVCMFLAGKVEETPRPLKDVILVSYEIIHKKDAAAAQRIKQKEVYEHQKELLLQGERVVLATLGFDLNVHHPYKPLVEAIKKFKVAQNALAQVAWNFVNDGLRTSLCLQ
uniref:Cyclin-T1-3-like n=1 Tax=Nicotiana tabacum TaxID=4097 RepID=A0A1S3XFE0_TOBAC